MKNLQGAIALSMALAMAGCSGGGYGGDDGGGGGGNGGGGGGNGGGGNPPTPNGTAEIVFPWTSSTATARTVTVRGRAADPEGVARVLVNGADATLTATASASTFFAKTGLAEGEEVDWSAEVDLDGGENSLVVSVEDADGDVTEEVDKATISYVEVPFTFTHDPDGARVVGLSYTLTASGYVQNLVEHNYDTLEQTVFEGFGTAPATSCFRHFENEFLYLSFFTGTWELRKYDLTAEQDSLLMELPASALEGDAEFQDGSVRQLVCSSDHAAAYVLVNHQAQGGSGHSGSGYAKSRLLEVDLFSMGATTLSESDTMVAPRWIARHIALGENEIVSIGDGDPAGPLTSVSLDDGDDGARTELATVDVDGLVVQPELALGRAYVATFDGIDEIDLVMDSKQNISPVDDDHPLAFAQVRAIGFDAANSRVIVGDEDLDALIAVDTATGERSELLSRKVGTGTALIAPRRFAISADGTRAYVGDDGGNAAERLFEIDLATGDRRVVGDIGQPFNVVVTGLALDEAGGRVFVSFPELILEVDIETGEDRTIADTGSTDLDFIAGLALDAGNDRLLVGDFANDGIFAIDLATEAIDVVSQEGVNGDGPAFGGVVSLTAVAATPELYVAGQTSEAVTRVDLETGDRETLQTACDLAPATSFEKLGQVLYNESANELLISGDRIYGLDLESGQCTTLRPRVSPFQVRVTSGNQLLAVSFRALMQFDRETGEVVIVSK